MYEPNTDWPEDGCGDVFRRLRKGNFDFSKSYAVDYNVDFENWPPAPAAVSWLERAFGDVTLYPPENDSDDGYILFQVEGALTYEGVKSVMRDVTAAMEPFGGVCESWGVFHD
jgi:hypothetical protein